MAENRGGARTPSKPASSSGVGKNSRRTDGRQPVAAPHVQEGTDLTQGDGKTITAGQSQNPLSSTGTPSVSSAPRPSQGLPPSAGGPMALGEHLFSMPSTRPGEPETEGLPFGAGGGPEVLESYQAPTEKEQLARLMLARSAASPRWQAVIESIAEENRVQGLVPSQVEPGPMETATTEGTDIQ